MGSLFKRPKDPVPVRMPDTEDPNLKQAEQQQRMAIRARGGRQSTMLTRRSGGAGTAAYGNSLLGQAG